MRSSILKTQENCERSISSDPEDTRNSKKPSRTRVRSWKHQWLTAMPFKIMKNCGSGGSNKIKTKLARILEADESTRLRMENSITTNHHEDHIARKRRQFITALQFGSQICSYASSYENSCSKSSWWIRNGKNWRKFRAWNLTKVRSKKQVIDEARTNGAKVHFASLMDMCHLKNSELEAKHQKYKGRVVLRGDIVKDDSGFYVVFTEQG